MPTKARGLTVGGVEFSPSGEHLAVAQGNRVELWEIRSGKEIGQFHAVPPATRLLARGQVQVRQLQPHTTFSGVAVLHEVC